MKTTNRKLSEKSSRKSTRKSSKRPAKKSPKSRIPFMLFNYRQALYERQKNALEATERKLELTKQLIEEKGKRIRSRTNEKALILARQIAYKQSLEQQQWVLSGGLREFLESDQFYLENDEDVEVDHKRKEMRHAIDEEVAEEQMEQKPKPAFNYDCSSMDIELENAVDFNQESDWSSLINAHAPLDVSWINELMKM